MDAGRASIIAYTMPLWAAVLSIFFLSEKFHPGRFVGLSLGIAGITILIGPDIAVFKTATIGAFFMLFAAMSWGAGVVAIKAHKWSMPTIVLSCWSVIIGGIPLAIGAVVTEPSAVFAPVSLQCVLALVYVILLGNIVSYWAWYNIIAIFPVTVASIGTLMIPIIGVFSSALTLGELVGFREIVSLVLVVSALFIVLILPGLSKDRSDKNG
jgi:drug/metabolite transporter (DMT)-like permease